MFSEWGRFVTTVKLNRGLKESNYDQLYAYLKQHEVHANDNKIMLERFTQHTVDPLALMSNVLPHQPFPMDNLIKNLTNTLALFTQSYKTYLPQTNNQLRTSLNTRNQATVQDGKVVVQNVLGRQNKGQGNIIRGTCAVGNRGAHNRVGNVNPGQARQIKCYNCNGIGHIENRVVLDEEQLLFIACGQDNVVDEDMDEPPVQDLALNVDNVFQADECDAFDSDDVVCELHEVHEMHDNVQPNGVVDSDAEYTSDSNMISYDQYENDNAEPVVQNNVSSVPNDMSMIEQKIEEQLRIVITDRNIKEENLKKELHSVKMQINSTIKHNKSMVEEVTSLKKDFKWKENKYHGDQLRSLVDPNMIDPLSLLKLSHLG
nr:hypothetical protein [Tanacetum cinerariifolium]